MHLFGFPVDMAGLPGMAQVLDCYHTTLAQGRLLSQVATLIPTDVAAILEWGLDSGFLPIGKPPLAIAMQIRRAEAAIFRRYRLVVVKVASPRMETTVANLLRRQGAGRGLWLPGSGSEEFVHGYAADGYRSPLWLV